MIDAIDAVGRHYSGYSDSCAPKADMVAHCTLSYPDVRGHAPWATIVLRVTPASGMDPITLTIHSG